MVIYISGDVCVSIHKWLCVYDKNIYMYILAYTYYPPQSEYLRYPFDILNILLGFLKVHLETRSLYHIFIYHQPFLFQNFHTTPCF